MSITHALAAATLCCVMALTPAFGAEPPFDGYFWRQSDLPTKRFFTYSFMIGVVQGQDRVAARLLIRADDGDFRPECHQAVSKNVNVLEKELTRLDQTQFITAMDAFYGLKKNRPLEIKWAVLVVMQQLQGKPQSDLEAFIENLQRQAP